MKYNRSFAHTTMARISAARRSFAARRPPCPSGSAASHARRGASRGVGCTVKHATNPVLIQGLWREKDAKLAQKLGQLQPCSCMPTGMHVPTCIISANLTTFSLGWRVQARGRRRRLTGRSGGGCGDTIRQNLQGVLHVAVTNVDRVL